MAVPDTKLRNATPENKRYRISVGNSVYLEIMTTGHKVWRMRYRRPDTQKQAILTIGNYPDISQPDARQAARDAKALLTKGIDPAEHRKQQNLIEQQAVKEEAERIKRQSEDSFENVARAWHNHRKTVLKKWKSEKHAEKILTALSADIFPKIGDTPITELSASDLLDALQPVIDREALGTATKLSQWINDIYRYATTRKLVAHNEADNLKGEIPTPTTKNNPYLIASQVHDFIDDVEGGDMGEVVKIAILLTMHTLARTGEIRYAKWSEFDLDNKLWDIPAERMKMKRPHLIPLSDQAIKLLTRLQAFTGQYDYLFVTRGWNQPMSENGMLYALYRMGYKGKITIHGLRATGSTILNDSKRFREAVIEMALAHAKKDKIEGAYNHALYLEERREMLQWYSDYLDGLHQGAQVIPINKKRA